MVKGFNRSISLSMNTRPKARTASHMRSSSLPSQSHPLFSNLQEQIWAVRSSAACSDGSLPWIEASLSQIELLHSALHDFLSLSDTKNVLQQRTAAMDLLLDILLCLVDSFGSMLSVVVTLKQQLFDVQSALRRCDSALLASSLKAQRRTEKELSRLVSSLHTSSRSWPLDFATDATEAEVVAILKDSIYATSAASVEVFNGVVSVSMAASTALASKASSNTINLFRKIRSRKEDIDMVDFEKLGEMEECTRIVENGSAKVFRSLLNSRVSLLNIQSDFI